MVSASIVKEAGEDGSGWRSGSDRRKQGRHGAAPRFCGWACRMAHGKGMDSDMEIRECLNELFVQLFHDILVIEEKALKKGEQQNLTINDIHVIDAIGDGAPKNMSSVAKSLQVTTGTLTISVNSLVKKGYVDRVRSEEDRRVVLISLTETGRRARLEHKRFHERMIERITERLSPEMSEALADALTDMIRFFKEQK